MSLSEKFGLGGALLFIALLLAAVGGWAANLIKLIGAVTAEGASITLLIAARAVGVIIPLIGAVLGYF